MFVIAANLDMDPALELLCSRLDGTLVAIDQDGACAWTLAPMPDAGVGVDAGASDAGPTSGDVGGDARGGPHPSTGA